MEIKFYTYLFIYFAASSLIRFIWVLLVSMMRNKPFASLLVKYMTDYGSLLDLIHLALAFMLFKQDVIFTIPNFAFESFDFDVNWNIRAILFLSFSVIIISVINRFSTIYLFRDPFYFKFFAMIYLLQLALILLILTQGNETIFIGWEFLGITSILLIAFYEYRISVLKNSLVILAIYKVADLFLYSALLYSTAAGETYYDQMSNPYCIFALLLACLIKSSVFPWYWLPRAVEGPTQSTAVFYGSLATHIPIFIFMNVWGHHSASINTIFISIATAFILLSIVCASMLSKTVNDAKNSIAYAAIAQLGIIYLEVLFGFIWLAIVHCLLHGIYRTTLFLLGPSIIYEHQLIEQDRKVLSESLIFRLTHLMPIRLQLLIYKMTYNEFFFPRILMHHVENFMGLFSSRMNALVVKAYIFYSLAFIFFIELITFTLGRKLFLMDELLLILAYVLNILAMINKYRPWVFYISLTASVMTALLMLSDKLHPILVWSEVITTGIMLYILIMTYLKRDRLQQTANFMGQMHQSSGINFLLFILGLSIIGMPGLGIFFIWVRLEHALINFYPGLILSVYVLLSLNTIVFFRFYYVNFLGKYDVLKQIKLMHP